MNRANTLMIGLCVLIGSALLVSCKSSETKPAATPPVVTATPAVAPTTQSSPQHWVQDQQLRGLMNILAKQTSAVPGQAADVESPPGFLKNQPYDQVATLADGLAQTSLQISRVPGKEKLSTADQQGFDALAKSLHDQALELKAGAEAHQLERMQNSLTSMSNTCTACHTRYRDLSGLLEPRA